MNRAAQWNQDDSMRGLRVLLHRKNNMRSFFIPLLEAAKQRWNWQIDVFCDEGDGSEYRELVGDTGKIFVMPDMEQPFAWESDPQAMLETDERIRRAEIAARTPISRIPLASERNIGAAYVAPNWNVTATPLVQRIMRDNSEASRIARRYFRYADDLLAESAPDFILTYEWGKPFRFATWMAAAGRGIPCIAIRRSKILSDRSFCTTHPLLFNSLALERARERANTNAAPSEIAKAHIAKFRQQPEMVQYIQNRWRTLGRKQQAVWYFQLVKNASLDAARTVLGRLGRRRSAVWRLVEHNRQLILAHRQERFFHRFDESELAKMKYVFFPMHKETDISQTFQAALWHEQRNTIQILASLLPGGYRLLVREHRLNRGLRPMRYYRELAQLPNVVLIDALDSQYKYLNNADLVVTENGSSGWEALLLNRRVITLAQTFYDGAGLSTKVTDANRLGAAIIEVLARPAVDDQAAYDRALECMLDAERETTFSPESDGIPAVLDSIATVFLRTRDNVGVAKSRLPAAQGRANRSGRRG
jgi:hypothetical protein